MTEITPARLRELADETNAATAKAFDAVKAVEYHSDEAQTLALCGNLLAKLYPALRAAADQQERDAQKYARLEEANLALLADHAEALATLAAREALLRQAMDELRIAAGVIDGWEHEPSVVGGRARALAAEIAAALGAGIPPNTDDQP